MTYNLIKRRLDKGNQRVITHTEVYVITPWFTEEVDRDQIPLGEAIKDVGNQVDEGSSGPEIMRSGFESTLKDPMNGKAPEEDKII
jgi:uncharacterized protein YacL (UPF0231 family)